MMEAGGGERDFVSISVTFVFDLEEDGTELTANIWGGGDVMFLDCRAEGDKAGSKSRSPSPAKEGVAEGTNESTANLSNNDNKRTRSAALLPCHASVQCVCVLTRALLLCSKSRSRSRSSSRSGSESRSPSRSSSSSRSPSRSRRSRSPRRSPRFELEPRVLIEKSKARKLTKLLLSDAEVLLHSPRSYM